MTASTSSSVSLEPQLGDAATRVVDPPVDAADATARLVAQALDLGADRDVGRHRERVLADLRCDRREPLRAVAPSDDHARATPADVSRASSARRFRRTRR